MENLVTQNQSFEQSNPSAAHRVLLTRTVRRLSGALALALFVLLAMAGGAYAQTIVYTDTVPTTNILFTDSLDFPQFDPSLGILTGVTIEVTGEISGSVGVENAFVPSGGAGTLEDTASLDVVLPNGANLNVTDVVATFTTNLGPPDGVIDFDGPAGETRPITGILSDIISYSTAADLAPFLGTGNLTLPITATNEATVIGASFIAFANATAGVDGSVTYEYVVPELTLEKSTNGVDADSPIGPYIAEGDPVTWTYVVSNTGTVDVPTVDVTDSVTGVTPAFVSGDANNDGILNAGEAWTYEASGTATAGQYMNIGTVEGTVPGLSDPITSTDPSHYFGLNPEYVVSKVADQEVVAPGTDVTYTYLVTNTGNITLTNVVVTDDLCAPVTIVTADADGALAVGEVWEYTCTATLDADTTNTATVGADDPTGPTTPITTTETVDVLPTIDVIKTADPTTVPESGGDVTFTFEVVNTSQEAVTLTDLVDSVYGDLNGQGTCATGGVIAVGASYTCTITETLSGDSASVANGLHTNTVTATAEDDEGNPVSGDDDAEVVIEDLLPTIDVLKTADPISVPESGGDVTFTFTVTNTSQEAVTLTDLTDSVYGDLDGVGSCATGGVIAVGGSYTCAITDTLSSSSDSVTNGLHTNTVTATAEDDEGNPVSADDDAEVMMIDELPTIDVIKTANPTAIPAAGGVVTFTFEVVNTSAEPVTLTDLTDSVYGDLNGQGSCATGGVIAVGASYICEITDTLNDGSGSVVANIHTNTVTAGAEDDEGNPVSGEDDAEVLVASPIVEATKTDAIADTSGDGRNGPGDTISYTIVIENSGLVPAEAAFLNDLADSNTVLTVGSVTTTQGTVTTGNGAGDTSIGVDIGDIASGGSVTITFDVVIVDPLPDGVTQIENQGIVTGNNFPNEPTDDPDTPADDDPTVTPLELLPELLATKRDSLHDDVDGNGSPSPGDYLKYEVVIVNNGNTSATGVVFNDQPDPNTKVDCTIPVTTTAGTVDTCDISLISVNIGTMAPGAQVTIEFYVRIDNPLANASTREVANQGLVDSNELPTVPTDDPDTPEDGDPTVTPITVAPIIESTKNDRLLVDVDGDGLASPGDILLYEVIISNEGNVPVDDIVFSDTVDPNTTLVIAGGAGTALLIDPVQTGQGTVVTADPNGDPNVVVNVGTINPGEQVGISFRVQINNPLPAGVDSVANQGIVNGTSGDIPVEEPTDDPETPEEDDPTVTPISAPPSIQAYKSALTVGGANASGTVAEGDIMNYIIRVVNSGTGPATGVFIADTLDLNSALITGSVQTGRSTDVVSFGNNPGDVSVGVALDTIPGGSEVTVSFQVELGKFNRPFGAQDGCRLVNQAVITYDNTTSGPTGTSTVSTDDPNTAKFDATITAVNCSPTSLPQGVEADFIGDDAGTAQMIFLPFATQ